MIRAAAQTVTRSCTPTPTGFYSLSWTMNGSHSLLIRKTGFEVVGPIGESRGTINATVRGDTRLDIELVRR